MIGTDHPQASLGLEHAAALLEPRPREGVVVPKASELVPGLVNAIDPALVRSMQLLHELEIIRRVGENDIDRCRRDPLDLGQAIADQNRIVERPDVRPGFEPHLRLERNSLSEAASWSPAPT